MKTLPRILAAGAIAALAGLVFYERHEASRWRAIAEARQTRDQPPESESTPPATARESRSANSNLTELLALRSEVGDLRQQLAAATAKPPPAQSPPSTLTHDRQNPGSATSNAPVATVPADLSDAPQMGRVNFGSELGNELVNGDASALAMIKAMAKVEHDIFNSTITTNDEERANLARSIFAPLHQAFDVINEAAARGNRDAINAVAWAVDVPELQGMAINSLGALAGNGNDVALNFLLHSDQHQIAPSLVVGALKPAADTGNQQAIDFLAGVAMDGKAQGAWYLAADGLSKAAESGNTTAIDALAGLLSADNKNVRDAAISGLQRAAAKNSLRAAAALSSARVR